jgi:hypothetical protein
MKPQHATGENNTLREKENEFWVPGKRAKEC